jgi:diadenylate cyclase
MQSWWTEWEHAIDTGLTALLFWGLIRLLRHRRHGYRTLAGVVILGLLHVAMRTAGLELASSALLGVFALCALVFALSLQDELRRVVQRLTFARTPSLSDAVLDVLVRAADHMADRKVGALIVLPGREPLLPHISGGVRVDAMLSEPLLLSLFDPGSPGHDGAVVIRGAKVDRFAVRLPLSQNEEELAGRGTRHASSLGLSEQTDATCIVVSEERGQISVARGGRLEVVDEAGLRRAVSRHLRGELPPGAPRPSLALRALEIGLAVAAAAVLWFAVVPGGVVVSRTVRVPVRLENLPEGYQLDGRPITVDVTLSGARRALYLLGEQEVEVSLDAWFVGEGKRSFGINRNDVTVPQDLTVLDVYPRRVEVRVRRVGS